MILRGCLVGALLLAAIPSAPGLDSARFAELPEPVRTAWTEYLARSGESLEANRFAIYAELESERLVDWTAPKEGDGVGALLRQPAEWFRGEEARRIAEVVRSFQTPAGGWSKALDLTTRVRRHGELFAGGSKSWAAGTIDNGATTTEIQFLARVAAAANRPVEQAALQRGLEFLLSAQLPAGGWPQFYPLIGGYHDAVTFNDNAFVNVLRVLHQAAEGRDAFASLPAVWRERCAAALQRGLRSVLETQIVVGGRRTGWGQQYDPLTLQSCAARAFEPVALATGETAGVLRFLMELETPTPDVVAAVQSGIAWLQTSALEGFVWEKVDADFVLQARAGSEALWPRYLEIGSNRPLFADRDGSIHEDVRTISRERRNGYAWYVESPRSALKQYRSWLRRQGSGKPPP